MENETSTNNKVGNGIKPVVMTRFFIVYYLAQNINGGHNIGDTVFSTDGVFLNRIKTVEQIKILNPAFGDKIVISGIMEVTKVDYDRWNER